MNSETLTFESAFKELEQIIRSFEDNALSVDEISAQIQRAAYLITFCREKLQQTDLDVQKILSQLDTLQVEDNK